MTAWLGLEPLGNWALVLGIKQHDVRGLLVQGATGEFRVVSVSPDGLRYEAMEWSSLPEDTRLHALPAHPRPGQLQSFVANLMLGSHGQGLAPLIALDSRDQPHVIQWAMLKLAEQFGAVWIDPSRRGNLVRVSIKPSEPFPPDASTSFRRLPASSPAGDPVAITAAEPPFQHPPAATEFELDPALTRPPSMTARLRVRALRTSDIPGALARMRMEPQAFDPHDLEQAWQEMLLASRPDQLPEPLRTTSGYHYARTEYWVMTEGTAQTEAVRGLVGSLQFYGANGQYWYAYLCGSGSILTEVLLRRGRDLGFAKALVWTTPDNTEAVSWYRTRGGFSDSTERPLEVARSQAFLAFERSVLPLPRC